MFLFFVFQCWSQRRQHLWVEVHHPGPTRFCLWGRRLLPGHCVHSWLPLQTTQGETVAMEARLFLFNSLLLSILLTAHFTVCHSNSKSSIAWNTCQKCCVHTGSDIFSFVFSLTLGLKTTHLRVSVSVLALCCKFTRTYKWNTGFLQITPVLL